MAVTTKKLFPATSNATTTVFSPVGIQLNNQDDLDVYVTLSGGTRVLQLRQSTSTTAQSSHPQVNNTNGLYFPAVSAGTTLYNYQLSTDNNTITFNTALPQGAVVFCERRTRDADSTYTSFASGSTIRATDLNNSSTESNFTAQDGRNKALTIEGVLFRGDQPNTNFVTTDHIVNDAVTQDKLANNSVGADQIIASSITVSELNSSAVTTAKINDGAVTTLKIADDAVTQDKIADNAVGAAQIAASSITVSELNADAVTTAKINDSAVTQDKLANNSVGTPELINGSVTTDKIVTGTLDNRYYTEVELNSGQLDNRYFTETELSSGGAIDSRYYTESELDAGQLDNRYFTETELTGGALDGRYYTETEAEARFLRQDSSETIASGVTWSSVDNKVATTAAIDARIIDLVDDVGGFVPIATEEDFPTENPDINNANNKKGGTIVSVKAASTALAPQSGTTLTIANGRGTGNAVIITGVTATIPSGFGFLVETTATDHTYAFHRLVPKATEVTTVATNITNVVAAGANVADIHNFADTYQISTSAPTARADSSSLNVGDLWFDSSSNKVMMVYDGSSGDGFSPITPDQSTITAINSVSGHVTFQEDLGLITNAVNTGSGNNSINTVGANIASVNTVANSTNLANITAVAADQADIGAVAAKATEIGRLGTADAVADLAILGTTDVVADMNTLATADIVADMNMLATSDVVADMALLATTDVIADMNLLAVPAVITDMSILGTADVVADMAILGTTDVVADMNMLAVSDVISDMNTLAVTSVLNNIGTVAASIGAVNRYADEYVIQSGTPSSPSTGDLWYNTTSNVLNYYNGSTFVGISPGIAGLINDANPALANHLDCNDKNLTEVGTVSGNNLQIDFGTI